MTLNFKTPIITLECLMESYSKAKYTTIIIAEEPAYENYKIERKYIDGAISRYTPEEIKKRELQTI